MSLPLAGLSILVTRPAGQAAGLSEPLTTLGALVFALPAIAIAPPVDFAPFDEALRNLAAYDWVVLTSVNGVAAVRYRMEELGISPERLNERKIAVTGPATGDAVRSAFREPDLMPEEYVSESIAQALGDVRGLRILLARADIARKDLGTILRVGGARVDEVAAYQIVAPKDEMYLPDDRPDIITLTSSSAVHGTRQALAQRNKEHWMHESRLACIGPITAATVRELGYKVSLVAREFTIAGLVEAIVSDATEHLALLGEKGRGEG
jgi:uroporphyrinogen-III synthase